MVVHCEPASREVVSFRLRGGMVGTSPFRDDSGEPHRKTGPGLVYSVLAQVLLEVKAKATAGEIGPRGVSRAGATGLEPATSGVTVERRVQPSLLFAVSR